jgi:hypothetical protein
MIQVEYTVYSNIYIFSYLAKVNKADNNFESGKVKSTFVKLSSKYEIMCPIAGKLGVLIEDCFGN